MGEGPLHVVLFPWLAFGHLIPFLKLSKSLAKRGHHIFFISTPRNIDRLPNIPLPLVPLIDFISIPLPPSDDLPVDAEATTDLPPHKVPYLKKAFDKLDRPIAEFLEQASPKPDWIICDFVPYWLPPIASKINIPCAYFNTFPSFSNAFFAAWRRSPEQLTVTPEWNLFPTKVAYRLHEARSFSKLVHDNASGVSDNYRFNSVVKGCDFMAVRGCLEFDGEWLSLLPELYKKPIVPLGLLPSSADERPDGENTSGMASTDHGKNILKWLNKQTPKSVVYVSLGSEATLSNELVHELAFGLELSGLPFLWGLRRKREEVELLPKGFEDRIAGRGVVSMGWMPQPEILACSAVGGFFTHCGWSSLVEGLAFGHPLILLPIFGDQGINARVMVEKKVGLEVERDEETGSFTREAVAKVLRSVMVEGEGKKLRQTAKQIGEFFSNKDIHGQYVDAFVHYLRDHGRFRSLTM